VKDTVPGGAGPACSDRAAASGMCDALLLPPCEGSWSLSASCQEISPPKAA